MPNITNKSHLAMEAQPARELHGLNGVGQMKQIKLTQTRKELRGNKN